MRQENRMPSGLAAMLGFFILIGPPPAGAQGNSGEFSTELPDLKGAKKISGKAPKNVRAGKASASKPVISGEADVSEFFRRLESIGLDTKLIRKLTGKIEVFFKKPGGVSEASWGYILDNMYVPHEFKKKGTKTIRFDLPPHHINTLIHEYTHAARDILAREDSPKGTSARAHYDAVAAIQGDLRSQAYFYRYSWMKADEVSGYYMGNAIGHLFECANDVVFYNTRFKSSQPKKIEEAKALGDRLIIPSTTTTNNWEKALLRNCDKDLYKVSSEAEFQDNRFVDPKPINWPPRDFLKADMYNNILGLKPHKNLKELLTALNTLDNEWIKEVRVELVKARLKYANEAEGR